MINIIPFYSSSKGNLFLVQNEETKILLECGINEKEIRKLLNNKKVLISDLNGCLVSHAHNDHALSVEYILEYTNVYSTLELKNKYNKVVEIKPLNPFNIKTIKILPIPIEHGKTENNGFIFKDKDNCIFFGTDFSLMEHNLINFAFNKIYIECNWDDYKIDEILKLKDNEEKAKYLRQISTHMSVNNCKTHLRRMNLTKCEEICLLHASQFLINQEKVKKEFEKEFKIKTYFAKIKNN